MKIVSISIVGVIAALAIIAGVLLSMDASTKATTATATANTASLQSSEAMATATRANETAGRAEDKADAALGVANAALEGAKSASRGELTAIVAAGGAVLVVLAVLGGVFMLIVYGMRNAHTIQMATLVAPPAWSQLPAAHDRYAAEHMAGYIDAPIVESPPRRPRASAPAQLGEPLYLIRRPRE